MGDPKQVSTRNICVKNNINEDIKRFYEGIKNVGNKVLKVKGRS